MKKLIVIVLGVGLIIALSYMAINLKSGSKITDNSLIAFAIEDTSTVDRIDIYDSFADQSYTISRNKEGIWVGEKGECVQQNIVQMMLETMNKVTLKGYVPKSAMYNMKKILMANHKSVKIYQNGSWSKTWYVGHSTQDHMGTHMLLETPDIKSDNPVIMGMKGFYGILEPRFFADPRRFACVNLFSYKSLDLKQVEVINRVIPESSYLIKINGPDNIQVTSNGNSVSNINKDNLTFYLNGFENINFNQPNFTLSNKQIDSIKASTPDYELNVTAKQSSYKLDLYRRLDATFDAKDTLAYDQDYLWAVKPDGILVRMQYYTVGPLLQGKTVFVNDQLKLE
ncbi:hypothetical protein ERX46_13360 [Brumimicrobium glaciale]|uniref:DUF4340 domain-containing protein n=1 Tax=Brumimicrobium glaciale TaxID=200475 RepID=A0A4Q4KIA3_9FLAO|nr:hypothetical protein [Brumimicrobium glaciale]RYM33033.1 hypothetical protein ERX46_13360 [Brumimicrobium glaciale]